MTLNKYTIDYKVNRLDKSSFISIPIKEKITNNKNIGDIIGIYQDGNCLEFIEDIDIDNKEVVSFVKNNFNNYQSVLGFMRRVLE